MFTDIAGTNPANIGDPVGRVVEASPLSSNWQAPSVGQRPRKDPAGVRVDYFGTPSSQVLTHASTPTVDTTNCTLCASFIARDAAQGPGQVLIGSTFSMYTNGTAILNYNDGAGNWPAANIPQFLKGQRVTFVGRFTPTGLKMFALINGVPYSDSLAVAVTGSPASAPLSIGALYGSMQQAGAVLRAITDSETQALAYWCDAQQTAVSYSSSAPMFAISGDSIARNNPGAPTNLGWCWLALQNIRATYANCEILNTAIVGNGTSLALNYNLVAPYYSPARSRNVYIIACGTNELANGNGTALTLTNLFANYDGALAAGWRPLLATVIDRTGSLSISQAAFDAQRATVNAAILSSGRNVIDLTGVAGVSAVGASAGANFIGDGVHPGTGGHGLMEAVYRAAMLAQAA